jgi:hypothetical protein
MATEKLEPTFTIKIMACQFNNLSQEDLIKKLKYMHDLNLRKYYTIVEDVPPETKETPK